MIGLDGFIKVGDFGSMVEHFDQSTPPRTSRNNIMHTREIGTPPYDAPEAEGGKYDHRFDIFSMAFILFELVTPFPNDMERYESIYRLREEIPDDVDSSLKDQVIFFIFIQIHNTITWC